jgi:hypothetical protein
VDGSLDLLGIEPLQLIGEGINRESLIIREIAPHFGLELRQSKQQSLLIPIQVVIAVLSEPTGFSFVKQFLWFGVFCHVTPSCLALSVAQK